VTAVCGLERRRFIDGPEEVGTLAPCGRKAGHIGTSERLQEERGALMAQKLINLTSHC